MYKIGPVFFDINGIQENELCRSWLWKLDAFRIRASISLLPDIAVVYNQGIMTPDSAVLMSSRISGFYEFRNYTEKEQWIWELVRKRREELLVQFVVDPEFSQISLTHDMSNSGGNVAFEALSDLIFPCMLKRKVLTFHGVIMEYEGKGIILSAASGVGKTTHARLWRDCKNALIINGDRAACYRDGNEWKSFGTPWCGTSGEFVNREVSVCTLVVLERGEENSAEILEGSEALIGVWNHVIYPRWHSELTGYAMQLLDLFLKKVKVIKLVCRPDQAAVDTLFRCIEDKI